MGRTGTSGAAAAGRGAGTRVAAGEGTGNLRPINQYVRNIPAGATRNYARAYVNAITSNGNTGAARQRAADAGLSPAAISRVEREVDSRARTLTDRRRGANR